MMAVKIKWVSHPALIYKAKKLPGEGRIFLAGQFEEETKWAEAQERMLTLEGRGGGRMLCKREVTKSKNKSLPPPHSDIRTDKDKMPL